MLHLGGRFTCPPELELLFFRVWVKILFGDLAETCTKISAYFNGDEGLSLHMCRHREQGPPPEEQTFLHI